MDLPYGHLIFHALKFQRSCLTWAFGKKPYADIISANGILPVTYIIQLSMIFFFVSLCLGKYDFNIHGYVQCTIKPENKRWNMFNPFTVNPSFLDSSFFHRAVNAYNYLYKHNIHEEPSTSVTWTRDFLKQKVFQLDSTCFFHML